MSDQSNPRPQELEDRLDALMEGGAEQPTANDEGYISTNPNESEGEHESMAIADSDHDNEPGEQMGGGS